MMARAAESHAHSGARGLMLPRIFLALCCATVAGLAPSATCPLRRPPPFYSVRAAPPAMRLSLRFPLARRIRKLFPGGRGIDVKISVDKAQAEVTELLAADFAEAAAKAGQAVAERELQVGVKEVAAQVEALLEASAKRGTGIVDVQMTGWNGACKQGAGTTALMMGAQHGQLECVRVLLAAGADTGAQDGDGRAALELARRAGHGSVAELLEK